MRVEPCQTVGVRMSVCCGAGSMHPRYRFTMQACTNCKVIDLCAFELRQEQLFKLVTPLKHICSTPPLCVSQAGTGDLTTGILQFRNSFALNKNVQGMPDKSFTVEFWARGPAIAAAGRHATTQQGSQNLVSYATSVANPGAAVISSRVVPHSASLPVRACKPDSQT